MDDDTVFTKRFIDCVRKPHPQRTEQDLDYICHTLKKLSEFSAYDSSSLRCVPERLIYEQHETDSILYSAGERATCWYYVLRGSVMISMHYFYSTGSSFGQCSISDLRGNQCHVIEASELLRVNYSEEELQMFANRAAKLASRHPLTSSLERLTNQSQGESTREELVEPWVRDREFSIRIVSAQEAALGNPIEQPRPLSDTGVFLERVHGGESDEETKREWRTARSTSKDVKKRRKKKTSENERRDGLELDIIDPLTESMKANAQPKPLPLSADILERHRRSRSEERSVFTFTDADVQHLHISISNDSLDKAMQDPIVPNDEGHTSSEVRIRRRTRDRERRYSAPPGPEKRSSALGIRDSVGSMDYLSESQVDSDDEESVQSETSSSTSMDAVLEVLSKPPVDRTDEDIERVMDVLQYMPVFSNMTSNIRRALFQVLMLHTMETENMVLIDNGDEVDKWFVVLNGQLKLYRGTETEKVYHVGDSFGISASLKILPQRGRVISAAKDTTVCYVFCSEYSRILTQGEENMMRVEREGVLVAVLEKRAVDAKREGYFIVQATPEYLIDYLLEDSVDDTFAKDFLLTYRTFLSSATPILTKLRETWPGLPEIRDKITKVVLNWVTEHYSDFEGHEEMTDFLDWFETRLLEDGKVGEKRGLDKARSLHARVRHIEMDRAGTNSPLDFTVVGGWEVAHPIFVSGVEPKSIPERSGLRIGDQILEINDAKCVKKELREVLSILRKNFKLSLKVRSNLPEYKQFMADPPKPPPDYKDKSRTPAPHPVIAGHVALTRCNSETVDGPRGRAHSTAASYTKGPGTPKSKKKGSVPRIFKPLTQIERLKKLRVRSSTHNFVSNSDHADSISISGPLKANARIPAKKPTELADGPFRHPRPKKASSLEDIHTISSQSGSRATLASRIIDSVVKLYQPDHSYKYIDVSPTTTVAELIARSVKDFYPEKFVASPPDEYCLCMVTVQSRNGPIRNSVLPNHMSDLANFIGLESRYYLKERAFHGTLVQDEEAEQIFRESRQWEHVLNLSPKQVAEELTRQDSEVFCSVDASEYIADLWRNPDHLSKENLERLENIPNDEMYWVVTTVVSETRSEVRAKLIKQFIKISKWSKELRNFNTMFHILSGLTHGLVQRQRSSWEKVPGKYRRTMEDLVSYMNPFHNMAKYRELQRSTQTPLIPLFPILKKDLTFLFDGNETQVGGLVNFEKLRMLSRQIRVIKSYCQQQMVPEPPHVDLGQLGVLKSIHHSIRMRNRGPAALATLTDNALKKVYHHHRMMKMVRKHLSRKYVIQEEDLLEKIADSSERMVQMRKNPPSSPRGTKTRSIHKEKHKSSPSVLDTLATPPISPWKSSTPNQVSGLASTSFPGNGTTSPHTPPRSPSHQTYGTANGSAQCPQ